MNKLKMLYHMEQITKAFTRAPCVTCPLDKNVAARCLSCWAGEYYEAIVRKKTLNSLAEMIKNCENEME